MKKILFFILIAGLVINLFSNEIELSYHGNLDGIIDVPDYWNDHIFGVRFTPTFGQSLLKTAKFYWATALDSPSVNIAVYSCIDNYPGAVLKTVQLEWDEIQPNYWNEIDLTGDDELYFDENEDFFITYTVTNGQYEVIQLDIYTDDGSTSEPGTGRSIEYSTYWEYLEFDGWGVPLELGITAVIEEQVESVVEETFQQGFPELWSTIDADGDTFDWEIYDQDGHDDSLCIRSASYEDGIGPLSPDNYLITPKFTVQNEETVLKYWLRTFDEYFPEEHYKLKIAITDSPDLVPDDFTILLLEETVQNTQWEEREISLSDFSGENIYIAWEHCNVSDQYYLMLDDILVTDQVSVPSNIVTGEQGSIICTCFPNPISFQRSPFLNFSYSLPVDTRTAEISIYNIKGEKVKQNYSSQLSAGWHSFVWNGTDEQSKPVGSGVYLYKLNVNGQSRVVRKLLLLN